MTISTESSTLPPHTVHDALKAFVAAQERRVATWVEYDDAMRVHLDPPPATQSAPPPVSLNDPGEITLPTANGEAAAHRCATTAPQPIPPTLMQEILRLVTSSLLDVSHEVRALETELRTALGRTDLADIVGSVQDDENAVLRAKVRIDQMRKQSQLGVDGTDSNTSLEELEQSVRDRREEITEKMREIAAELADLSEAVA